MENLSPDALRILKSYGREGFDDLDEFTKSLAIAFAQNAGLAGLLPGAIAELSFNTAIAFYNTAAEFGKQFSNQNK